jgi:1-acyl-sn-glycerol-3-phosphate acyltransferase
MSEEPLVSMKPQVYKDPRPKEWFDRFHHRSRTRRPNFVYELVRLIVSPLVWFVWRARCIESANVPAAGPVILAPNHFSFLDHFFLAAFLRRKIRFMAKSQLFTGLFKEVLYYGGTFPVRRGHADEEAFVTAETILGQGGCLAMYCEGGRSRTGRISDRAKPGIGRLALESGAPVVPVAIYGSQRARNWKRLQFPKVTVQFGQPIQFEAVAESTREQQQACADQVLAEIRQLYGDLEAHGRRGMVQRARAARRAARRGERPLTA